MKQQWKTIRTWIERNTEFDPGFDAGASLADVREFEAYLGRKLPADFADSLRVHTAGTKVIPSPQGFMAHSLMSIDESIDAWTTMNEMYDAGAMDHGRAKVSKGVVQQWWAPYWLPFASDGGGDYFCLDLCPTYPGVLGQVLWVPHDFASRPRISRSFGDFMAQLSTHYKNGLYSIHDSDGFVLARRATFPSTSLRN